jgi:hypothetical protein
VIAAVRRFAVDAAGHAPRLFCAVALAGARTVDARGRFVFDETLAVYGGRE